MPEEKQSPPTLPVDPKSGSKGANTTNRLKERDTLSHKSDVEGGPDLDYAGEPKPPSNPQDGDHKGNEDPEV